jgi:hypothetical protein
MDTISLKMANAWETHQVEFAPTEGLSKNETEVRVLDHNQTERQQVDNIEQRLQDIDDQQDNAELLSLRNELTNNIKKDPGYKFLMQVSAFSKLKLGNIIHDDIRGRNRCDQFQDSACEGSCPAPAQANDHRRWMDVPEITGTVQLSAVVYGHIKEAEMIVRNRSYYGSLKDLVESPLYQTPFARLVALRIILSGVLTGLGNRRDRSFSRLHQEQHMLLRQFDRIGPVRRHDWSRPVDRGW